jgi:hypothetical protein
LEAAAVLLSVSVKAIYVASGDQGRSRGVKSDPPAVTVVAVVAVREATTIAVPALPPWPFRRMTAMLLPSGDQVGSTSR